MKQGIRLLKRDDGSNIVELALLMPVLLLLLVGAVDLGRAYSVAMEVSSAAHAGALYGSQNPTDTAGIIAAATLDAADVPMQQSLPQVTLTSECYDGIATPPCSNTGNSVYKVQVNTSATYTPLLNFSGIPAIPGIPGISAPLTVTGQSIMRAAQ